MGGLKGTGVWGAVILAIGPLRSLKHFSEIKDVISDASEHLGFDSSTTITFPVFLTELDRKDQKFEISV